MKQVLVLLLVFGMLTVQAQSDESFGKIKIGAGYTHDFPGLNGYTVAGEYIFPLIPQLEGGIGVKHVDLKGYPRTTQVQEYTRANTLDFNFYWVPLKTETHLFRVGLGYSFSFYNIKRAYPIIVSSGDQKGTTTWPSTTSSGRVSGINVMAEYEYSIPNSPISIGLRAALYKAYDGTSYIGPVIGYQL